MLFEISAVIRLAVIAFLVEYIYETQLMDWIFVRDTDRQRCFWPASKNNESCSDNGRLDS